MCIRDRVQTACTAREPRRYYRGNKEKFKIKNYVFMSGECRNEYNSQNELNSVYVCDPAKPVSTL